MRKQSIRISIAVSQLLLKHFAAETISLTGEVKFRLKADV
jgi:hypothetical protein